MKIGFLLPGGLALEGAGHGVRRQAEYQALALEQLGHEVVRFNPWNTYDQNSIDVIQFFGGGFPTLWIEKLKRGRRPLLSFATMIDSNEPNWRYRLAASMNGDRTRLYTIPGVMRQQALASDLIVVRSTHERERAIEGLGATAEKVEIVLNGAPPPRDVDAEGARRKLQLPSDFILHVSLYTQERKNVLRLIEAVKPTALPLVIAGTATEGQILDKIRAAASTNSNIRVLGFLEKRILDSLYSACRVFCLPSLHEGTGLVAVEAASYGAQVVITQNGGPRDYFAALAEYVDPFDVNSIRQAIERAWAKPRSTLLQEHARALTWERSAQQLVQAYSKRL